MNKRLKQTTATLALILAATFNAVAQPYGHSEYINLSTNYKLSKGFYYQNTTPGFVMGGWVATSLPNTPNIVVYRTMPGGGLFGSAWTKGYFVIDPGLSPVSVSSCLEMNIIEVNANTSSFLAAMVNKDALYVFTIDNNGVPSGAILSGYRFPAGTTNSTKPRLLQLANTDFVVTGSYTQGGTTYIYFVEFTVNGIHIASATYQLAQGVSIIPNDMIESPFNNYTPNELAVVGTYNNGSKDCGFIMMIDYNTFGVSWISKFDNSPASNEKFGGIVATTTGDYYIHGSTNSTGSISPVYKPTCMSVQADAITTNWSNWYQVIGSPSPCIPTQIVERPNTYSTLYDYYMGYTTPAGAKITKLDPSGNLFAIGTNTTCDMQYSGGGTLDCQSISYNNNAGNDEGMHLYGTNSNNNFHLVQAYFNLKSNPSSSASSCFTLETAGQSTLQSTSGSLSTGPALTTTTGLVRHPILVGHTNESVIHNQVCGGDNSDILGNNQKVMSINEKSSGSIKIYPSIVDNEIMVENLAYFRFEVYNLEGQLIAQGSSNGRISTEKLKNGLYLLQIVTNDVVTTHKIIVSH